MQDPHIGQLVYPYHSPPDWAIIIHPHKEPFIPAQDELQLVASYLAATGVAGFGKTRCPVAPCDVYMGMRDNL